MVGVIYHFGTFSVDVEAHALVRNGSLISIQEQPFQVLLALLASPGQVVSRETLRLRLWGTTTFVDFDQSLNSAVRRLRLALGDSSRAPVYIETLPRAGFRLLVEVTTVPVQGDLTSAGQQLSRTGAKRSVQEAVDARHNAGPPEASRHLLTAPGQGYITL